MDFNLGTPRFLPHFGISEPGLEEGVPESRALCIYCPSGEF